MAVKPGDKLPGIELYEGSPADKVNIFDLFAGSKKGILFGVPGAFTPGCTKTHLPGYIEKFAEMKEKGVDLIVCVSVNDPFVMSAWGEAYNATGKVRMLADMNCEFTQAIGMDVNLTEHLGSVRSRRYSLLVEKGVVTRVNCEPEAGGLTCSLAPEMLKHL